MAERPGGWTLAGLAALLGFYVLAVHWPEPRTASILPAMVLGGVFGLDRVRPVAWALILAPAVALFLAALWLGRRRGAEKHPRRLNMAMMILLLLALLDVLARAPIGVLDTLTGFAINLLVAGSVLAWVVLLHALAARAMGVHPFPPRLRWLAAGALILASGVVFLPLMAVLAVLALVWLATRGDVVVAAGLGAAPKRWLAGGAVAMILAVSAWSLAVMAAASRDAARIAGGASYCIAVSNGDIRHEPTTSLLRLRGSQLIAIRHDMFDDPDWYAPALLVVSRPEGLVMHLWSHGRLRFVPASAERAAQIHHDCFAGAG